MKNLKKSVLILAAVLAVVFSLTGCFGGNDDDMLTISIFDPNFNTQWSFGRDPVSQAIMERTGVRLEYRAPGGDANQALNLMLASGDFPDILIIGRHSGMIEPFISAGAIIPLEGLIEQYAPDLRAMYEPVFNRAKAEDGHIYGLPNWYALDESPVLGFLIRQDFLSEIAPEDVVNGERHITEDEFLQFLREFNNQFPQIDGAPSMAMTLNAENWGSVIGTFKGMFGIRDFHETDGNLYYDFRDPRFRDMLAYMNTIFREGLLDVEWATNRNQQWNQKLMAGNVFSTVGAFWDVGDANQILSGGDVENSSSQFLAYKVVANGVDPLETTFAARSPMGWDIVAISRTNRNPEATMTFLNFMASEEGQILTRSGVEGMHFDIVDGARVARPDFIELVQEDYGEMMLQTGIRSWSICVKNGFASDGLPFAIYAQPQYSRDLATAFANRTLINTIWDRSPYEGLEPTGNALEALNHRRVQELSMQFTARLINAASVDEFDRLWDEFMSAVDASNASTVEQIITENFRNRRALWGL